jgi:oligopeptide/dipeptide ABC transporter ATP-binding protein
MTTGPESVLRIENLSTEFRTKEGVVKAVVDASVDVKRGTITALTGESGSGKSTLAYSVLNLVPHPGKVTSGRILFHGRDLMTLTDDEWRRVRGNQISMIFQDPSTGLNPILPIGAQVAEILTAHRSLKKKEARQQAIQILRNIGLADPERVANAYPFQVSGGMAQRVMIAIATALDPEVIIADEPTSALDVTVQAAILDDLDRLRRERDVAILLITHNFGVVAQVAQDVSVMYGGRIVEQGSAKDLFARPRHPYSWSLLAALPRVDDVRIPLPVVPGSPPTADSLPDGLCPFLPRCAKATIACREGAAPVLEVVEGGHRVACYNPVLAEWAGSYR